jgi:hypothetical protein
MKLVVKMPALLALALLPGLVSVARAQDYEPYPGGVTLLTQTFDPTHPTQSIVKPVFGDPQLMSQVIGAAWQASRATIDDQIIAQLGKSDSVAKGVTPYDIVSRVGASGDLSVQTGSYSGGSTVNLRYLVHGNSVEFTCTQPTVLGKWADPRFSLDYDLELTMAMNLADASGAVRMTSVTARILNPKIDSHGIIADTIFVANDVSKFFKGPNFIQAAQNAINGKTFDFTAPLNKGLAPFNALLAKYGGQGFSLVNSVVDAAQKVLPGGLSTRSLPGASPGGPQMMLYLNNDGKLPTGSGQISGSIRWKKAYGTPPWFRENNPQIHPFAHGFVIHAIAQSGFAREGMFTPPMSETGVLRSATLDASSPDEYVLHYVINQLPLNVPMKVEVKVNPSVEWRGNVGGQTRIVGPLNWQGVITLKPGISPGAILKATGDTVSLNTLPPGLDGGVVDYGAVRVAKPGDKVSLNPQPLPPDPNSRKIIIVGGRGDKVSLNPQPLPPGPDGKRKLIFGSKRGNVSLNPQPLPPGPDGVVDYGAVRVAKPGDKVALNPQPLPPRPAPDKHIVLRKHSANAAAPANEVVDYGAVHPGLGQKPGTGIVMNAGDSISLNSQTDRIDILRTRQDPTGVLAVSDIDFDMSLLTGPH